MTNNILVKLLLPTWLVPIWKVHPSTQQCIWSKYQEAYMTETNNVQTKPSLKQSIDAAGDIPY